MARQLRIEYKGAMYHVLSRGNGRQDIFYTKDDRKLFIDLLKEMAERYNVEVHAFVLMSNHYHLLLKTTEANLSRAMQWFGTIYTRRFNVKNRTCGHLFQGRFKSIIVENDAYFLRLSCYIHRNPLRAGIVDRLSDYRWSSYLYYAYGKKSPAWLTTKSILDQLSGDDQHKAYRIKVQNYSDEKGCVWEDVKHGLIFGSQDFVRDLKSRFSGDKKDEELPQQNVLLRADDPQLLLKNASDYLGFNLEAARRAKRISPDEKEKRDMLIHLLWKIGNLPYREIGILLGINYSTVSKITNSFKVRLQTEKELKAKMDIFNSLFKV